MPERSSQLLAERAGVTDGDVILDAGCGVGGPAIAIASTFRVTIEAVTNSPVQVGIGRELVDDAGLSDRIRVHLGDMHDLDFQDGHFDRVLAFEVLCYSDDLGRLMSEFARVVRPGGTVYLKDIFLRSGELSEAARASMRRYEHAWACRRTPTMGDVVEAMERGGLDDVRATEMEAIGTDHFYASMLEPGTLSLNELGRRFVVPVEEFPVIWGEVHGSR